MRKFLAALNLYQLIPSYTPLKNWTILLVIIKALRRMGIAREVSIEIELQEMILLLTP